jgi:glycosyltransferase involved in cell wall biosynthesis
MSKANIIFTISRFSKERIEAVFHPQTNIVIVPIGVSNDISLFPFVSEKLRSRDFFLFVGNFKYQKGIDVLLEAYKKYKKNGGRKKLVLVGEKEKLRTSWNGIDSSLLEGVDFMGSISEGQLISLLINSYCVIQPSRYEGFGLPPMEALYLGTPAIISDIPVFVEIYPETCVTFFHSCSPDDLSQKMLKPIRYNPIAFIPWDKPTFSRGAKIIMDTIKDN